MRVILAHVAPLLAGHAANEALHSAIVANALTRTKETAANLAERRGVNRHTVAAHVAIIRADLVGTCRECGRFDTANSRIDMLLRDAGIVADKSASGTTRSATAAHETTTHKRGRLAVQRYAAYERDFEQGQDDPQ